MKDISDHLFPLKSSGGHELPGPDSYCVVHDGMMVADLQAAREKRACIASFNPQNSPAYRYDYCPYFKEGRGNSLVVQWLGLRASTAGDTGSISGRGTKIPHAAWCGQINKRGGVVVAK